VRSRLDTLFQTASVSFFQTLRFFKNSATSYSVGIDSAAPFLHMQRKAAAAANLRSFLTAKAAVKVSPAPVVLTIVRPSNYVCSLKASPWVGPVSLHRRVAPFCPSFDKIYRWLLAATSLSKYSICKSLGNLPIRHSRSVAFGDTMWHKSMSSSEMGSRLPPQSKMSILACLPQ
jgi:hypothetical protein